MKFAPCMSRFKAWPSQIALARLCDMVANGHDIVKLTAGAPLSGPKVLVVERTTNLQRRRDILFDKLNKSKGLKCDLP